MAEKRTQGRSSTLQAQSAPAAMQSVQLHPCLWRRIQVAA